MQLLDMSNNFSEIFNVRAIGKNIFVTHSSALIKYDRPIFEHGNMKRYSSSNSIIFDYETKGSIHVNLPDLFPIKFVDQFIDIHGQFYIVATDFMQHTCLFTSSDRSSYFVSVTCDLAKRTFYNCPILIHPNLPGVIFANINHHSEETHTHISTNDGLTFQQIKIDNRKSVCVDGFCDTLMNLPCEYISTDHFVKEWFITISEHHNLGYDEHIVSYNGGKTFKVFPHSEMDIKSINGGGITVGFAIISCKIIYSFDEGKTYYNLTISDKPEIIYKAMTIGKNENERIFIYGRDRDATSLFVTHIDFTYMFKRPCDKTDYTPWTLSRSRGTCFQGQEVFYWKKKINSMCIDTHAASMNFTKPCPCYIEDFQW
ncbi:VPS10 domain-containing receptor SorCS1 [Thelohanellus kitauei]|uniref:VPS10 domain-containing receptor SorCS1 n=1 Tax=Thelohanellus kitauei TaxID=669202 RepID=A0A0C2JHP1_THEKT|nr:VPS10 domain-containing receptor SorCS1 [Thelohanellus kitauei]